MRGSGWSNCEPCVQPNWPNPHPIQRQRRFFLKGKPAPLWAAAVGDLRCTSRRHGSAPKARAKRKTPPLTACQTFYRLIKALISVIRIQETSGRRKPGLGAASWFSLEAGQFVDAIEGGLLVAFGQGGIVEDRVDEVVHRAF